MQSEIKEICLLLRQCGRPLFHIGQGMRHAKEEFKEFIESIQCPFVTARNANDMFPWEHSLYTGRPGTFAQRGANFAVQRCDLLIAIGTRLSLPQTGYASHDYARNAKIIQVDCDQAELDKGTVRHHMAICADAKDFIVALAAEWHKPTPNDGVQWSSWARWAQYSEWLKRCQSWKERYPVCLPEYWKQKDSVNAYVFMDVLSDVLSEGDVIVSDMGMAFQCFHQAFRNKSGQRMLTNCGLAPMGWGLPAAIGSSFALQGKAADSASEPTRRVVCISGDGGLMMNVQELATVFHHQLPIKMFVLNNGGYATIKQTQEFGFGGRLMGVNEATGLSFPDFKMLADAHKIPFGRLENHANIEKKMRRQVSGDGPILVEVTLDPNQPQAPRALNRRDPDGKMNPTRLEDMHPFLDPEVIRKEME